LHAGFTFNTAFLSISLLQLLESVLIEFFLLLPNDTVRVLVSHFILLVIAAALRGSLAGDKGRHFFEEGIRPELAKRNTF
jgi:hypothetical protein